MFDIGLDIFFLKESANETFSIKDSVERIKRSLILGGVSYESLSLRSEGYIRGGDTVSLVVGDDFNPRVFIDSNATVLHLCISIFI